MDKNQQLQKLQRLNTQRRYAMDKLKNAQDRLRLDQNSSGAKGDQALAMQELEQIDRQISMISKQ